MRDGKSFLDFIDPTKDYTVTEYPLVFMQAVIGGTDKRHRDRRPPKDITDFLSSSARESVSKIYDDPYSTLEERMGLCEPVDRNGTRPGAREKFISIVGLLTIAQCKLCARGSEMEELVARRFENMQAMPRLTGSASKTVEKWQAARRGLPAFESAETTRDMVLCAVIVNLGENRGRKSEVKSHLRNMRSKVLANSMAQQDDAFLQAASLSATDFTLHTDKQIEKMISAIEKSRMTHGEAAKNYRRYFLTSMMIAQDVMGDTYSDFFQER